MYTFPRCISTMWNENNHIQRIWTQVAVSIPYDNNHLTTREKYIYMCVCVCVCVCVTDD